MWVRETVKECVCVCEREREREREREKRKERGKDYLTPVTFLNVIDSGHLSILVLLLPLLQLLLLLLSR